MSYATYADLTQWAAFYGVEVPIEAESGPLLELATADVSRYLGARYDLALLDADDAAALVAATAIQAVFRAGQGVDAALGLDDGLASVGGLSFSLRTPPRLSPEAAERLAGHGLFARSGTVAPDVLAP